MMIPRQLLLVHPETVPVSGLLTVLDGMEDCRIQIAEGTEAALKRLETGSAGVQLVLLHMELPLSDVVGFLRHVREGLGHIQCVLLATDQSDRQVFHALKAGAMDVLRLPVDPDRLRRRLRRCLERIARIALEDRAEFQSEVEGWVELTAPTDFEYVERFRTFTTLLGHVPMEKEDIEDLCLAVDELGQNAVEWGNRGDRAKRIHMSYCIFHDRILLKIADEGEGFDPHNLPDPSIDPIRNLMERKQSGKRVGGYGLFLVRKVMDAVIHNETGNVVILVKRFSKGRPTSDDTR